MIDFINIAGRTQEEDDCMMESWDLSRVNAYRVFNNVFSLIKGYRAYYNNHQGKWIPDIEQAPEPTSVNTG